MPKRRADDRDRILKQVEAERNGHQPPDPEHMGWEKIPVLAEIRGLQPQTVYKEIRKGKIAPGLVRVVGQTMMIHVGRWWKTHTHEVVVPRR